jgi:PDZ domain
MRKLLTLLAAMFFMAGPICISAVGEEISKGKVSWGITSFRDAPDGAVILAVVPMGTSEGAAAEKAGLAPGDVISSVDGMPVKNAADLKERIKSSRPYTPVRLAVQRFGTRFDKTLWPTGRLRLEVKDFDRGFRSFPVPGIPQAAVVPPATALDALENINVLQNMIIDQKSGQIAVMGSYDAKYATGSIPYLDLLKTALKYPEPKLNLNPVKEGTVQLEKARSFSTDWLKVILAMPAAERERQVLIREMAASYGITREEYVRFYNYAHFDTKEGLAPAEIGQILLKAFRHLGWNDIANAYQRLEGNTIDDFLQALKMLGKEKQAQQVVADNAKDPIQVKNKLLGVAAVAIMEGIGKSDEIELLMSGITAGTIDSKKILNYFYGFIAVAMMDRNGRYLANLNFVKIAVGDAAAKSMWGADLGATDSQPVRIETFGLDRNSLLARILYEADYAGKAFVLRPDLFDGIPGEVNYGAYLSRKLKELGLSPNEFGLGLDVEFWFEPKRVEMQISADKNAVTFGAAEITFDNKVKEIQRGSAAKAIRPGDIFKDWCKQYTDNYDSYAQVIPIFHELREAAKIIALARWIKQNNISVDLSGVQQEVWEMPETVPGHWRAGMLYWEKTQNDFSFLPYSGITGGVTFQGRGWTSYGPASKTTETKVPDQLVLSSQLGRSAVQAATTGDLEKARHYSELSAQALAGHVTRGELAKQNITLPSARTAPLSPARVQLQKELLKETHNQISALRQNPANAQAAANLGRINDVYEQVQSNPPRATEYLRNLQIRQALPTTPTMPTTPTKGGGQTPVPADSHAAPPASAAAPPEATYDCSLCDDGLRRNIRAKLDINAIRMLGTYVDGSISFYNNCKLKATKTCEVGDQFVRLLRVCDDRRADETAYYVCINDLMSLRP